MSTVTSVPSFLRKVLLVDAASAAALGVLLIPAAAALAPWLGLPPGLLRGAGAMLLPFAAYVALVATRLGPWRRGTWIVVACNAIWCVDSVLLVASGRVQPTVLGTAFVLVQAAFGAVMAALEVEGLRRARRPALPARAVA